jgi:HAD superfamily hydrolase (TIGR01509 family)
MKLADLLGRTSALLLDFDGPICAVFAGYPASTVAAELHAVIADRLGTVPPEIAELTTNPLRILRRVADLGDAELTRAIADACRDAEVAAVATASPTPGAGDVLRAARECGRRVAVISNNSSDAVEKYLQSRDLVRYIDGIAARFDDMDPRLLKPDPLMVKAGLATVRARPADAVLVGDSVSDIEAGRAGGTATIGYANKPGKHERLTDAGADVVIDTMTELADAVRLATVRS